jgi:hypothetical protein
MFILFIEKNKITSIIAINIAWNENKTELEYSSRIGFPTHAVTENAIPKKLLHNPITNEWFFSELIAIIIIGAVTTIPK